MRHGVDLVFCLVVPRLDHDVMRRGVDGFGDSVGNVVHHRGSDLADEAVSMPDPIGRSDANRSKPLSTSPSDAAT